MEPIEFKPKRSLSFWAWPALLCILFFTTTVSVNRRFLEDPSTLADGLAQLILYAAFLCFAFFGNVKRVIIDDRIVIDRYLAPTIVREFQDFIGIADGIVYLRGYSVSTSDLKNGRKLIRIFEKLIVDAKVTVGNVPDEPIDDMKTTSRDRIVVLIPFFVYLGFVIFSGIVQLSIVSPHIDRLIFFLIMLFTSYIILRLQDKELFQ